MKMNSKKQFGLRRQVVVEACEVRRMFVGFEIAGTSVADSISISINGNDILWAVNGVSDSRSDILFNEVTITGNGGSDTITIVETGNNTIVVNGGNGDDTVNFGIGTTLLSDIDDNVTVNGDAGDDHVLVRDINTADTNYSYTAGNRLSTAGMAQITLNVEDIELRGGAGVSQLFLNDPVTTHLLFNGGGSDDKVFVNGAAGESVVYRTGGQSGGSGSIDFASGTVEFFSSPMLVVGGMDEVTMRTSFSDDIFTVSSNTAGSTITGVSGGIVAPPAALFVSDDVPICKLDFGTNDSAALGDDDSLTFNGNSTGTTLFRVDMGGGDNVISVNGDHDIDTRFGFAGGQFNDVSINNATARFHALQTPRSLTLHNNATAAFIGTGTLLSTPALSVTSGNGSLNLASGQTGSVVTTFTMAAGATLTKLGGGTFTVASTTTQTHGLNSTIQVNGGTFNLNGDAGSASSRRVNAVSGGGTLVFNASQHLRSVFADGGTIRMASNGSRVIVTEFVGINNDIGGKIDLTNNNLILDYAGTTQELAVRDLLTMGFAGGAWNGIGLQSSTAAAVANTGLGYAHSPDLFTSFPATFAGEAIDSTSVLVRYTFNGDTDLNRTVNFDDLLKLAQNYGPSAGGKSWRKGNSNYDTTDNVAFAVGFDDLLSLSQNYNQSMLVATTPTRSSGTRARSTHADILE